MSQNGLWSSLTTLSAKKNKVNLCKQGRKPVFSEQELNGLKRCIVDLDSLGFPMNNNDLGELVESYSIANNVTRALKIFKFKGRQGYPGPDWINTFVENNNLSFKEATKLSRHRYNATKNPFIIYNFYDILEKVVFDLNLQERPNFIWNIDESGLLSEPNKCKVISEKGQKTLLVNPGADKENNNDSMYLSIIGSFTTVHYFAGQSASAMETFDYRK